MKKYRRIMPWLFAACTVFMVLPGASSAARPEAFGYAPAQPKKMTDVVLTSLPPGTAALALVQLRLHIDRKGKVDSVWAVGDGDSRIAAYYTDYLKGFEFEPAVRDDKKVASLLPIELKIGRGKRYPEILFPVEADGTIAARYLFNQALVLAGFELPQVVWFPSFHATVTLYDSLSSAPFTVVEMTLDTAGQPTSSRIVYDSYPDFGRQLESAVLWSRFAPARLDGAPIASTSYLVVSYFPEISYPTLPFERSKLDSLAFLRRYQLTILPDTFGLARPPVPARLTGDEWRPGKKGRINVPSVSVWVKIDTLGSASVFLSDMRGNTNQQFINDFVQGLRFYPAVTLAGRPVPFTGLVVLRQGGRGNVRIDYNWLK